MYPQFDIVRQNDPKPYLASLQVQLLEAEEKIIKNKKDKKNIRRDLDAQWEALHMQEKSLRENFEHFDKVSRECRDFQLTTTIENIDNVKLKISVCA